MEDIFAIQDDISQAIVKALRVILSEGEKRQIERPRAANVEAYDFYLRGRQHFHQLRRSSLEQARLMFNKAIEIDPNYALAHAGVADCYSHMYAYFDAREFNLRQADASSSRALELQPDLAEAHSARGLALSMGKRFDEAEGEFERAVELGPQVFEAFFWFGQAKLSQGKYAEAVKLFSRAQALRPEDFQVGAFMAMALTSLGRRDEALAVIRKQAKAIDAHLAQHPDDSRACIMGANTYANLQDPDKSAEYAARAVAVDPTDPMVLYNVACLYSVLGRTEDCLTALEDAVNRGWGDKAWLEHDSDFDSVRNDPRYQALIRAM